MRWLRILIPSLIASSLTGLLSVAAQTSVDVERAEADENYQQATLLYAKLAKRSMTKEAQMAAARSYWAMSLPEESLRILDQVARSDVSPVARGEVDLLRAVIHFQEDRPDMALLYGQKALTTLSGAKHGRALLLIGDVQAQRGELAAAEHAYRDAVKDLQGQEAGEAWFRLGKIILALGKAKEATEALKNIPQNHERAAQSIKLLAEASFSQEDYPAAERWIRQGKEIFPQAFLDAWSDYLLLQATLKQGKMQSAEEIKNEAVARYAQSDPWRVMLEAAYELQAWQRRQL